MWLDRIENFGNLLKRKIENFSLRWPVHMRNVTGNKHLESILSKRAQGYYSLAEHLPDSIAHWDADGRYVYVNTVHEKVLATSASDLIGRTVGQAFPDGRFAAEEAAIARVIATGKAELLMRQAVPVNGEARFHDVSLVPERDASGRIVSVLGIGRDMTDLYRLQQDLVARERELRALANSAPGMMGSFYARAHFVDNLPGLAFNFHISKEGQASFPYVSKAIEEIYGLKPEDVRGDMSPIHMLAHPDDRPVIEMAIAESARTMKQFSVVTRVCRPDQPERWLDVRSVPESQPDGSIVWYGLMLDITERKQAEALLAKREREFRTLAESMPDNIVRYNQQGRMVYVNRVLERTLDSAAAAMIGTTPREYHPDGSYEDYAQLLDSVLARGEAGELEKIMSDPDGTTRVHQIRMVPEYNENGEIVGVLAIGRDITESKQAEASLAKSEQELRRQTQFQHFLLSGMRDAGIILVMIENASFVYTNDHYVGCQLGYAEGELPGTVNFIELIHPDERSRIAEMHRDRLAGKPVPNSYEIGALGRDGSRREYEFHVIPVPDTEPQQTLLLTLHIDERKKMENAMRRNQEMLANAQKMTQLGSWDWDVVANSMEWSEMAFEICAPDQRPAKPGFEDFKSSIHPDDLERVVAAVQSAFEHDTAFDLDHRVVSIRKGIRIVHSQGNVFRDASGKSVRMVGTIQDITERKRAEHAVLKLNADLSATLNAIPDLLFEVDREGNQLRVHTRNSALSGQRFSNFTDPLFNELLTTDAIGIVMEALDEAGEKENSYGKVIGVSLAGRAHWFELSVAKKINFPDAEVTFIVLARNVTERFDAEQRIKEDVRFLEGMDLVNKAIQGAYDIQTMMIDVLDVVLSIFGCDRVFLLHPCDPDAARWTVPMERHCPQYPGILSMGADLAYDQAIADKMRMLLSSDKPVKFGGNAEHAIPPVLVDQFQVQSLMSMAIHPQIGSPWEFGIQQCHDARNWKPWEERLVQAIGRRLSDSLSAQLAYQDLLGSEEKLRQSNKQLLELTMLREADREDERKRIAREIHDELGQNLTALRMGISQLRFQFGAANPELASHIEYMHKLATSTLQTVRDVTKSLRPPVLDAGIGAALLWLVNEFQQSIEMDFCLNLPSDSLIVDDEHALAIFRIIQESLTNVVRHASATRVDITVQDAAGTLHIGIVDNGQGFDADKIKMGGFGLIGMSERARMTGGSFEVQTQQGEGTRLTVIVPAQKLKEAL